MDKKAMMKKKAKTTLFWSGLASALILLAQNVATLFGFEIPEETVLNVMAIVNSVLSVLVLSGVLVNPEQVDSFQAMVKKKK